MPPDFSKAQGLKADEVVANIASPHKTIYALHRLKAEKKVPDQLPKTMTAFSISNHMEGSLMALLSSHSAMVDRIAALQRR